MFKKLNNLSYRSCQRITFNLNNNHKYINFYNDYRYFCNNKNDEIENENVRNELINVLRKIDHPSHNKDIVYLGLIKKLNVNRNINNNYNISIDLELDRHFRELKKEIIDNIQLLNESKSKNIDSIRVNMAEKSGSNNNNNNNDNNPIKNIKNIIAISSCKGGVGKSSIAVNLAYTLSKMNYAVGIFDADIYGPSLPTLTSANINNCQLIQNIDTQLIYPIIYEGVKLMSFGFVHQNEENKNKANIMRGPMVTNIIQELLFKTDWNELDYLIIDLPPGTSDIHITLTQKLNINGSIIITTPQLLSLIDVKKGIEMFNKVNVPILGLIKNMSYYICKNCQTKQEIFSNYTKNEQFDIDNIYELPIYPLISQFCDYGDPIVLNNDKIINKIFDQIANDLILSLKNINKLNNIKWQIDSNEKIIKFINDQEKICIFNFIDLRLLCKCALCIDEMTNKQIITKKDIDEKNININYIEKCGNYGVKIVWFDKHESIYSFHDFPFS